MSSLFYELQIVYSHPESDALKSADDLKRNANKYVIIWLSK